MEKQWEKLASPYSTRFMFSGHVQIVRGNILIVRIRKNEMIEEMLVKG